MHPKFKLTEIQTHNLLIMDKTFHIPEILFLTTEPPGTPDKSACSLNAV